MYNLILHIENIIKSDNLDNSFLMDNYVNNSTITPLDMFVVWEKHLRAFRNIYYSGDNHLLTSIINKGMFDILIFWEKLE